MNPGLTMTRKIILRRIAIGVLIGLLAGVACIIRPGHLWFRVWLNDRPVRHRLPPSFVDDASRMNRTHVAEVWPIPADPNAACA